MEYKNQLVYFSIEMTRNVHKKFRMKMTTKNIL